MLASIDQVAEKSFDYIIAGGGTAGLTLAVRLSEDPSVSVLVLEAGDANLQDPKILTPAAFASHFGNPQYDWGYMTVPQEHAAGKPCYWARGKGLGGSSTINFFQYHLPAKSDIDAYEKLGNKGWNWDFLKKYYLKSERFVEPEVKTDTMAYDLNEHGKDGPLTVAYPTTLSGFEKPYQEALKSLGIDRAKEPFSGDTKGTWLTPVTINPETRVRSYAANMYYEPNASRKNLTVLASAHVARVTVKKEADGTITATGVEFMHSGKTHQTFVTREVVLSSGTIINPQILELSGIGPKEVIQKAGIKVIVDLPGVGNNVQDHVYCGVSYEVRKERENDVLTFDCLQDPEERKRQYDMYQLSGKGVFGMSSICMTFVPLASISPDADILRENLRKSIQSGMAARKFSPALEKQLNIQLAHIDAKEPSCEVVLTQTFSSKPDPPQSGKKYITMASLLNHPISRGTIHIKSDNPLEHPAIDPHYFEEEYDMKSFVEMVKFNRRLVQQEPLKSFLTGTEINPGPKAQTDDQIADHLKQNFSTTFHTIGSCSMLPLEDGGVVDTKLKVYHTTNIRVCDISLLPLHIGAHMQGTAYALGELGADIIKGKV